MVSLSTGEPEIWVNCPSKKSATTSFLKPVTAWKGSLWGNNQNCNGKGPNQWLHGSSLSDQLVCDSHDLLRKHDFFNNRSNKDNKWMHICWARKRKRLFLFFIISHKLRKGGLGPQPKYHLTPSCAPVTPCPVPKWPTRLCCTTRGAQWARRRYNSQLLLPSENRSDCINSVY